MGKVSEKKKIIRLRLEERKIDLRALRKNRIEKLKVMINNEEYVNEAITRLANTLTSGLMK